MEHTTIEQAREALAHAEADCEADFGTDAVEAAAFDLIYSVADDCSPTVRAELLRTELGILDEQAEFDSASALIGWSPADQATIIDNERAKAIAHRNRARAADRTRAYQ